MRDNYKVEKQEVDVVLTLTDGTSADAKVFLAPHSKVHGGIQTFDELLEEASYFLPLKVAEDRFVLAGKAGLAAICTEKANERELQFCTRVTASLRVTGLGELVGEIIVPESHEHFRVSDYLNDSDNAWVRFEQGTHVYWVSKMAIMELHLETI